MSSNDKKADMKSGSKPADKSGQQSKGAPTGNDRTGQDRKPGEQRTPK